MRNLEANAFDRIFEIPCNTYTVPPGLIQAILLMTPFYFF